VKARLGAVLFGIGVFAVVLAAGAAFYVAPAVTRLPYDLKLCKAGESQDCLRPSVAEAVNAHFLQTKGGDAPVVKIQTGTLRSTTEIDPRADLTNSEMTGDLAGKTVVWDAFGTVKWVETNEMISQYSAELALDRVSAAAVPLKKQFLQDAGPQATSTVEFAGLLYKFPFHTAKKDYQYFDRDLRRALPIEYQGTEDIKGLETYRFQQVIPEQALNFPAERLSGLLNTFAPGVTSGQVTYSNTRTMWVEPVSGTFIKVQEQQKKTLVPATGASTALLDGSFLYTDETVSRNVESAGATKSQVVLIGRYLPIGLAVLGAVLLILGLFLVSAARRQAARRRTAAETEVSTDDEEADGRVSA
jgi:hypothetical protein